MKKSLLFLMLIGIVGCTNLTPKADETKQGEDSQPVDVAKNPTQLGDTPQHLSELALLTSDVWVAYNSDKTNQTPDIPNPTFAVDYEVDGYLVGNCRDVNRYSNCEHNDKHAMYGMLIHPRKEPSSYIVVFRGTADANDMKADLKSAIATEQAIDPKEGKVGKGFYDAYSGLRFVRRGEKWENSNIPAREKLTQILSGQTVTVTGHSLGAVLATYLSYDLAKGGVRVAGKFFASPKFGDNYYVSAYEQAMKDWIATYQVYNYKKDTVYRDVVPAIPPNLKPMKYNNTNIYNSKVDIKLDVLCLHHAEDYAAVLDPNRCSPTDSSFCGEKFWMKRLENNGSSQGCLTFKP